MRKVQVFTEGIVGELWMGGRGRLASGFMCIYDSARQKERGSLYDLCDQYLLRHGGDFQNPKLAGLHIEYITVLHQELGDSCGKTTTTTYTFYPEIEGDLARVVEDDWMEWLDNDD